MPGLSCELHQAEHQQRPGTGHQLWCLHSSSQRKFLFPGGLKKDRKVTASCVQFHGLVGQGHEARVLMMLNDDVAATMYDKDYSGNNNRYAMFGQSVILDMKGREF